MTKKRALGKGLSALLEHAETDITSNKRTEAVNMVVGGISSIPIDNIEANPFQPRSQFQKEPLIELSESIKEHGVIQPVTVRKMGRDRFQLISGERRFRASQIAGLQEIPAYIRIANDQTMLEMALVENIQRKDLDPIEVALSYQRLIDEINLTQEEMSQRVGKKRSTVTNYLRLLKLDPIIQTGMRDGFLSMGHGRALINIENQEEQLSIYENILKGKLSVRQTEILVKNLKEGTSKSAIVVNQEIPKFVKKSLKELNEYFGHKIEVKVAKNNKGKIIIPFHSEEDFNRIKKLLQ